MNIIFPLSPFRFPTKSLFSFCTFSPSPVSSYLWEASRVFQVTGVWETGKKHSLHFPKKNLGRFLPLCFGFLWSSMTLRQVLFYYAIKGIPPDPCEISTCSSYTGTAKPRGAREEKYLERKVGKWRGGGEEDPTTPFFLSCRPCQRRNFFVARGRRGILTGMPLPPPCKERGGGMHEML